MISLDIGPIAPSRKSLKRGLEFNVMVVGESGLGKSTLINTLLNAKINVPEENVKNEIQKTVKIEVTALEIEERLAKIRLSIIDTPGYGDSLNNSESIQPIVDYIETQLVNYFHDETGLNRRSIADNRVHCCLYFIEPMHRGLKELDIKLMQAIHNKVNIVPLLAKADCYTTPELTEAKKLVINDLAKHEITIYELPECDADDDPAFVKINDEMKKLVPFAIVGGLDTITLAGSQVRGRKYPWGFVNVEDESHSDFNSLKSLLFRTHIHDLREITEEVHYENFRAMMLTKATPVGGAAFSRSMSSLQNMNEGVKQSNGDMCGSVSPLH